MGVELSAFLYQRIQFLDGLLEFGSVDSPADWSTIHRPGKTEDLSRRVFGVSVRSRRPDVTLAPRFKINVYAFHEQAVVPPLVTQITLGPRPSEITEVPSFVVMMADRTINARMALFMASSFVWCRENPREG
jgi:hypothetical protein